MGGARRAIAVAGVLCVALPASASATTYRVGPSEPYTQPSQVAGLLNPGDDVQIDGGATYSSVDFTRAGTAAQPIAIHGVVIGGQRPRLSGGTNTIELAGDHYVVDNLDITGGSSRCLYHHADDITVRATVVHDCPAQGILGADNDSGSLTLQYVEVYHCGSGTFDHQIYMATDETAHPGAVFRMEHSYIHDANGGNNVKSRAERNEIYDNWIEGATYHELELIGPDPAGGSAENLKREDSDVVGNVLYKRNTFFVARIGGDGTGQSNGRYRFAFNTIVTQAGGSAVFRMFDGLDSVQMDGNVFAVAGGGVVNVSRDVEAVWAGGSRAVAGTGNWVQAGAVNVPPEWTGGLTGADPGFADATQFDLRPTATSPLVDHGPSATPGVPGHPFPGGLAVPAFLPPPRTVEAVGAAVARPQAGSIDIGAFEYAPPVVGVPPAGGVGPGPGIAPNPPPLLSPSVHDTTAPRLLSASMTNTTFAVAPAAHARATKPKTGTTFRYRLSEAARVTFAIERRSPGRRVGGRCVKPSSHTRGKPSCTRSLKAGSFTQAGVSGANTRAFSGRLGRRALSAGRYRVTLTARDPAGNVSSARRLDFTVVSRTARPSRRR